jgi:DNA modification methylase
MNAASALPLSDTEENGPVVVCGDALDVLKTLPERSVQCCVTSPPYWGLRNYGIPPSVFGSDPFCPHDWKGERYPLRDSGGDGTEGTLSGPPSQVHSRFGAVGSAVCRKCGAWKGCLGLEPTPELYVGHLVLVFREVRRVLRDDGTLWLNLGDTYAGSVRCNN